MADRNYINQLQADNTSTQADKHVITTDVTITAADDRRVGPYYPGNAKCILLVATGASVKFQMRGTGVGDGAAVTVFRDCIMGGETQNATAVKVGVMNKGAIPHEFWLLDTSGSDNACTMTWIY